MFLIQKQQTSLMAVRNLSISRCIASLNCPVALLTPINTVPWLASSAFDLPASFSINLTYVSIKFECFFVFFLYI